MESDLKQPLLQKSSRRYHPNQSREYNRGEYQRELIIQDALGVARAGVQSNDAKNSLFFRWPGADDSGKTVGSNGAATQEGRPMRGPAGIG